MLRRASAAFLLLGLISAASWTRADVTLTDPKGYRKQVHRAATRHPTTNSTGSVGLIDADGLKWFIHTDITFSTSSSASGAMSEASYTHGVAASTLNGGTTSSTLNDAYDGYQTVCLSFDGTTGSCQTGSASFVIYNQNGPATADTTFSTPACTGRQIVFAPQTMGSVQVSRRVFVPNNDAFARWLDIMTNTSGAPVTFNVITANNLGSDSNTRIVSSSNGNNTAEITDTWVSTFQNYSGTTSSDPRLGHILQGVGGDVGLVVNNFVDGDDNPFWTYTLTLAPGATASIANYASAQPSKAATNAKATLLATTPLSARQCLTASAMDDVVNFRMGNVVTNGGFENGLTGWSPAALTAGDTVVTGTAAVLDKSLHIVGNANANKRVTQTIAQSGVAGESYVLSGANQASGSRVLADAKSQVVAFFNNTDGTTSGFNVNFTRTPHSWQSLATSFTTTKPYNSITLEVRYLKQVGTADFDAVGLRRTN